jgi:hypothetical protein
MTLLAFLVSPPRSWSKGGWLHVVPVGVPADNRQDLLPYGTYTIPDISMVGKNERQLMKKVSLTRSVWPAIGRLRVGRS